jgi:iron(III) transport system ATP-binding protein
MVTLTIDRLGIGYSRVRVIDDLSLVIGTGSFFTLLGPSGCGKTTLLRALAGFLPAASGRILFGDRDVTHLPPHQRDIGMVFQDYALFPDRTVFENVAYGLRARRVGEAEIGRRVGEHLERVGLSAFPQRRPAELSGGQRQRVALARALVIRPTLLLMDEPLSNLDAKLRVQVRETIAGLQREAGITTVFVTHDQEEALALSDRIGLMNRGRLEQVGAPQEIYRSPGSAYVADFVGGANTLPIVLRAPMAAGAAHEVPLAGGTVRARLPAPLAAGAAVLIARPESIAFGAADGGMPGRIAARQFLGPATRYAVDIADGLRVNVLLHGQNHDRHRIGEAVFLHLDPTQTLAVQT